jgi:predicted transposase YbfD/YdcC
METFDREERSETELERGARVVGTARVHFKKLRDTRQRRGKRYMLVDVVLMSLLAMLCGCDNAEDIAEWIEFHEARLKGWGFNLERGTPSQDTILRVFELLKPKAFNTAVMGWLRGLRHKLGKHIAIDGKALRGSRDAKKGLNAVHMVSAWLCDHGLSLGQVATEDKSNEITAIPKLLELLDVRGSVVSIDAGGCHRSIAAQIVKQGGAYLLSVKDNQKTLHADVERLFSEGRDTRRRTRDELERPEITMVHDVDSGHGRIEERTAHFCSDLSWLTTREDWSGLCGVGLIESRQTDTVTAETTYERRCYITSDPMMTAARLLGLTRGHWSIESQLHWVVDVAFGEDASRIRSRRAAENFSSLRRTALSLLRATPLPDKRGRKRSRMSFKARRRYCDHRPEYLLRVLSSVVADAHG